MKLKMWAATAAIVLGTLPGISQARDTALFLPFDKVVAQMVQEKKLDGSVKFYLAGVTPKGKVSVITPNSVTNKKTNAFNKTDNVACEWALQSAILQLNEAAKGAGANALRRDHDECNLSPMIRWKLIHRHLEN